MPETMIPVDLEQSPDDQPVPLHNRWHPDIPSVVTVEPGESLRVECIDWTGGQINDNDSANDVRDVDLDQVHYLSGPIEVEGAEPGDLLVMEILDIGVLNERSEWGFTGIFDQDNGGGFLTDYFPEAGKTIWDLHGTKATSRHIPNVNFEGKIHPGLVGTAPSQELLNEWNERERALTEHDHADVHNHPTGRDQPPVANLPTSNSAVMGGLSGDDAERAAEEGARTVPPRENGGNCDIKDLSLGSTVYFPVYVDGGKLSIGDIHHSQGDGEISFCGAIEMAGYVDMRLDVIDNGVEQLGIDHPVFEPGHRGPNFSEYVTFEGYSVTEDGDQHYMDPHVAYRRACLDAIEYLKKFGYTGRQAYMMLSAIPIEGRHSGVVDIPNACSTLAIPKEVFDFDVSPRAIQGAPDSRGDAASPDGRLQDNG